MTWGEHRPSQAVGWADVLGLPIRGKRYPGTADGSGPGAGTSLQSFSGLIGAAISNGSLRQSMPGTSMYNSISLPSGSVM